jgi:hypothetical protein
MPANEQDRCQRRDSGSHENTPESDQGSAIERLGYVEATRSLVAVCNIGVAPAAIFVQRET